MSGNSFISMDRIECPHSDDVLRQYVTGRLAAADAEEFEKHMFECDRCAEEVERAIELRSVMRKPRQRRAYVPLAAAAIVAAVALSLWQARPREDAMAPPALRGLSGLGSQRIAATGNVARGVFTASWPAVHDARSYRVQVFDSIGETVTSAETSQTTFSASIGPAPRYWKVQALDDDHVVISSSELLRIQTQ